MKIKERANVKEDMESRRCKIRIERKKEEGKTKKSKRREEYEKETCQRMKKNQRKIRNKWKYKKEK